MKGGVSEYELNKAKLGLILFYSAYCASSDELWVSIILDMHVSVF